MSKKRVPTFNRGIKASDAQKTYRRPNQGIKTKKAAKTPPAGHSFVAAVCPTCKGTGSVAQGIQEAPVNPADLVTRSVGRIR